MLVVILQIRVNIVKGIAVDKKASRLLLEGFPRLRYYAYGLMVLDIPTNR